MDRETANDIKRHFDVVGEGLRSDIRIVAEGVVGLDEKFTREFERVREEIGEVKSLLRVSHDDLTRRVEALERKPS
jgi:threonine aldolase